MDTSPTPKKDLHNYRSRKFWATIGALLLITGGFLATAWSPTLGSQYGTFVGAITVCLGLYYGANLGNKKILTKPE